MRVVRNLDRVAEVVLKEVDAHADRDLELVHQNQENDAGAGVDVLTHVMPVEEGRPYRIGVRRVEERIGDPSSCAARAE